MNSCDNCRWLHIVATEYPGVGFFYCKLHYKEDPFYGKMSVKCSEVRKKNQDYNYCPTWEQGGLKGLIKRIKKFIKKI